MIDRVMPTCIKTIYFFSKYPCDTLHLNYTISRVKIEFTTNKFVRCSADRFSSKRDNFCRRATECVWIQYQYSSLIFYKTNHINACIRLCLGSVSTTLCYDRNTLPRVIGVQFNFKTTLCRVTFSRQGSTNGVLIDGLFCLSVRLYEILN